MARKKKTNRLDRLRKQQREEDVLHAHNVASIAALRSRATGAAMQTLVPLLVIPKGVAPTKQDIGKIPIPESVDRNPRPTLARLERIAHFGAITEVNRETLGTLVTVREIVYSVMREQVDGLYMAAIADTVARVERWRTDTQHSMGYLCNAEKPARDVLATNYVDGFEGEYDLVGAEQPLSEMFDVQTPQQALLLFKRMVNHFMYHFINEWNNEHSGTEDFNTMNSYQKAKKIIDPSASHDEPGHTINTGLVTAIGQLANSLCIALDKLLAKKEQTKFTEQDIPEVEALIRAHPGYSRILATFATQPFKIFEEHITCLPDEDTLAFMTREGMRRDDQRGRNGKPILAAIDSTYRAHYFDLRQHNDGTPVLDASWQYNKGILPKMASRMYRSGCHARGNSMSKFMQWIMEEYIKQVLPHYFEDPQCAQSITLSR